MSRRTKNRKPAPPRFAQITKPKPQMVDMPAAPETPQPAPVKQVPHAIETLYNGHRFRSRLESRWAVFFDALGVPYEYEKEGYVLDDGTCYLPDFWLPEQECWVEVKGAEPTVQEKDKARGLARLTEKPVYIFDGECGMPNNFPARGGASGYGLGRTYSDGKGNYPKWYTWCVCRTCGSVGITLFGAYPLLPCIMPLECQNARQDGWDCPSHPSHLQCPGCPFPPDYEVMQFVKDEITVEGEDRFLTGMLRACEDFSQNNHSDDRTSLFSYKTARIAAAYSAARSIRFEEKEYCNRPHPRCTRPVENIFAE